MSRQGRDWAETQRTGDFTTKAVLKELGNIADHQGKVYRGQATIAASLECNKRTIMRALQALEKMGLICRVERRRKDGSRTTDHIFLNMPSVSEAAGQGESAQGQRVTRVVTESHEGGDGASPLATLESSSESYPESRDTPQPPEDGGRAWDDLESEFSIRRAGTAPPSASGGVEASPRVARCGRLARPASPLQGEALERWRELASAYPGGGRGARQLDAQAVFAILSDGEQAAAIREARAYAADMRGRDRYPLGLLTWLRQTDFRTVIGGPAPAAAAPRRVFVRVDSPEWDAWQAHYRATTGRGTPQTDGPGGQGWTFPSLMPPRAAALCELVLTE